MSMPEVEYFYPEEDGRMSCDYDDKGKTCHTDKEGMLIAYYCEKKDHLDQLKWILDRVGDLMDSHGDLDIANDIVNSIRRELKRG